MKLTITASIHARWGHRVDDLIHTHAWSVSATVAGDVECDKVMPADDLERLLVATVEPWRDHYLTTVDVGTWKGYSPIVWEREPTVEEIVRRLWTSLEPHVPDLVEIALEEASEFDRCRVVRLTR